MQLCLLLILHVYSYTCYAFLYTYVYIHGDRPHTHSSINCLLLTPRVHAIKKKSIIYEEKCHNIEMFIKKKKKTEKSVTATTS